MTPAQLKLVATAIAFIAAGLAATLPSPWGQVAGLVGGGLTGWLGLKQPGQ